MAAKAIPYPVPIIAPPFDHMAKLPMSNETMAKTRLRALLEREAIGREEDGLFPGISERPPLWMSREPDRIHEEDETPEDSIKYDWEVVMGIGSGKRKAVIEWILTVCFWCFNGPYNISRFKSHRSFLLDRRKMLLKQPYQVQLLHRIALQAATRHNLSPHRQTSQISQKPTQISMINCETLRKPDFTQLGYSSVFSF